MCWKITGIDWIGKMHLVRSVTLVYEHQASQALAAAMVLEYIRPYEISHTLRLQNIFHNTVLKN